MIKKKQINLRTKKYALNNVIVEFRQILLYLPRVVEFMFSPNFDSFVYYSFNIFTKKHFQFGKIIYIFSKTLTSLINPLIDEKQINLAHSLFWKQVRNVGKFASAFFSVTKI